MHKKACAVYAVDVTDNFVAKCNPKLQRFSVSTTSVINIVGNIGTSSSPVLFILDFFLYS